MRSEERKEKSATEEGGNQVLPAVRGHDAEGRGMHGKVLEVPEQAMPMANVGKLGGEMKEQDITPIIIGLARKIAKHWRMEIYVGCWWWNGQGLFIHLGDSREGTDWAFTEQVGENFPIPSISDCLTILSSLGRIRNQIPSFNSFAFGEITLIKLHEALLSALLEALKEEEKCVNGEQIRK